MQCNEYMAWLYYLWIAMLSYEGAAGVFRGTLTHYLLCFDEKWMWMNMSSPR